MSLSMFPALHKGDNLLIIKNYIPGLINSDSNDVIVFNNPEGKNTLVKRVLGKPRDTLKCFSGIVNINGRSIPLNITDITCKDTLLLVIPGKGDKIDLNEAVLPFFRNIISMKQKKINIKNGIVFINGLARNEMLIEEDCYFVVGDNINNSRDSRYFGLISADMIIGKPLFVYWSHKTGRIFQWIK